MAQDKNGKDLGIGDEVVMHFRVTALTPDTEGLKAYLQSVSLESTHNRHGTHTETADFTDEPVIEISTKAFRTILQRKAKSQV